MSFLSELKQRKVFRIGLAYLVAGWLAVQVASIALPAFEAPAWALRVFILVVALGFPLALLLSWALELTSEGVKFTFRGAGGKRMALISFALIAMSMIWYFYGQPALQQQLAASQRSIAVLPFVNMSGDKDNEYFSDGLAETTLDRLAQVKDLRVIARTSSFAFKGKNTDVREIGRALDAAHLLEGSVQQAGGTLRITVQLVRSSDGTHLWSRKYDRPLRDVFAIQDEIAQEVVSALQGVLSPGERERLVGHQTTVLAAYDEYLKGNALLRLRNVAAMHQALSHFARAIALDPGYARAHAGAANTYILLETYQGIDARQRSALAEHVRSALALDPQSGEAHIAQAALLQMTEDPHAARKSFERGLALSPSDATGWQWYAEALHRDLGLLDEGVRAYRRALALDPLSPIIRQQYGIALVELGRFDEGEAEVDRVIREHPAFASARGVKARLRLVKGDLLGALQEDAAQQRLDPDALSRLDNRCRMLIDFSAIEDARACIEALRRAHPGLADIGVLEVDLLIAQGRYEEARRKLTDEENWDAVTIALALDDGDRAKTILKRFIPEMFDAEPVLTDYAGDPVVAAATLMLSGDTDQATTLLRLGLEKHRERPHLGVDFGKEWSEVISHTMLDEIPQACQALQRAVDAGVYRDLYFLDQLDQLAPLRANPCYAKSLAPLRTRLTREVERARAAGLLGFDR